MLEIESAGVRGSRSASSRAGEVHQHVCRCVNTGSSASASLAASSRFHHVLPRGRSRRISVGESAHGCLEVAAASCVLRAVLLALQLPCGRRRSSTVATFGPSVMGPRVPGRRTSRAGRASLLVDAEDRDRASLLADAEDRVVCFAPFYWHSASCVLRAVLLALRESR